MWTTPPLILLVFSPTHVSFVPCLCLRRPLLLLPPPPRCWWKGLSGFINMTGEPAQLLPVCVCYCVCVCVVCMCVCVPKKQQLPHARNAHIQAHVVSYKPVHTGIIVAERLLFYHIIMWWNNPSSSTLRFPRPTGVKPQQCPDALHLSPPEPYLGVIALLYYHFVYFLGCKSPV